jgi:hypothetical protein
MVEKIYRVGIRKGGGFCFKKWLDREGTIRSHG